MITVVIRRDRSGDICSITADSHAGFAEEGSDIICAGVSTLIYTAIGAMEELCGADGFYQVIPANDSDSIPYAQIRLPDFEEDEKRRTAQIILRTVEVGLMQLETAVSEQYGNQYLKLKKTVETSRRCKQ